jgi:hypothetical protein
MVSAHPQRKPIDRRMAPAVKKRERLLVAGRHPPQKSFVV